MGQGNPNCTFYCVLYYYLLYLIPNSVYVAYCTMKTSNSWSWGLDFCWIPNSYGRYFILFFVFNQTESQNCGLGIGEDFKYLLYSNLDFCSRHSFGKRQTIQYTLHSELYIYFITLHTLLTYCGCICTYIAHYLK